MPIKHKCNAFCAKGQTIFNFLSARYPQRKNFYLHAAILCDVEIDHHICIGSIYLSPLIHYRSHMPKVGKTSPYDHISVPYHVCTRHTVLVLYFDNVQCIQRTQIPVDVAKIHGLWFPEEGFQGGTSTLLQLWPPPSGQ